MKDGKHITFGNDFPRPAVWNESGNIPECPYCTESGSWNYSIAIMPAEHIDMENVSAIRIGNEIIDVKG